jgi:hypothetical protein
MRDRYNKYCPAGIMTRSSGVPEPKIIGSSDCIGCEVSTPDECRFAKPYDWEPVLAKMKELHSFIDERVLGAKCQSK